MLALVALAVLAPLLYIPGALLAHAITGAHQPLDFTRLFERVVLGALLSGWLALALGQLGIFSVWLHLLLIAAICVAAALVAQRRGALMLPRPPLGIAASPRPAAASEREPERSRRLSLDLRSATWGLQRATLNIARPTLALTAVLLLFGVLVARPFEVVIGVRDAGVYANAGFALARTGSLVQRDALLAQIARDKQSSDEELAGAAAHAETNFLGVQQAERNIATRLRAAGFYINAGDLQEGRVTPQGLHLFTSWVGLLSGLLGLHGGLLAPALMGLLGVWSVGMLGGRIAGPWAGVLAALLLALNAAQVWFSRYSTTETTAQFLTFAGLYFFAAMAGDQPPVSDGSRAQGDSQRPFLGLLCGLCIGQLALVRIDFFLVLAPLVLYLLYTWIARRWSHPHTALLAGLGAMLLHAAIQFTTLSRAYFFDTLFARLQDYAVTALVALPFLTPELRQTYLTRPCSPLTLQPCPPVAGMPPTTDAPWNIARIVLELTTLALLVVALILLRRHGGRVLARLEALLGRLARPLLTFAAAATLLIGAYAYLVRPQILTAETLAAIPACLAPEQLREPQGACLALQGYVGAPIATPGYVDPLIAFVGSVPQRLRGETPPAPAFCADLRARLLPPAAKGRTVPELIRDGLLDEAQVDAATMAQLRGCDRLVLRTQFANSQANLVRVGWYISPLGVALGLLGLALLWRRLTPGAWLFLAVALTAGVVFVRLTYGTSDQHYIYILRRYVPQVYPALALGTALSLVALARRSAGASWRAVAVGRRWLAAALGAGLVLFLVITGRPIFAHTEYGGALDQIEQIAARFEPGDVLLLRGGAPIYSEARDLPDVLATPLTYAYGLNAITVKSREPGRYAEPLARYVREWQAQGRRVFMLIGPSGALPLPGLALAPEGEASLHLREFEQLTAQKPRNVQEFQVGFAVYRVVPAEEQPPPPHEIGPADYAAQLRGFYRAETPDAELIAWTDGDALLRVELPADPAPRALAVTLGGGPRPASLGPARACLSVRPATGFWADDPAAPPFSEPHCFDLGEGLAEYSLPLDAGQLRTGALLLRIQSDPWIPLRDDPQGRDPRRLGVQFGGLRLVP